MNRRRAGCRRVWTACVGLGCVGLGLTTAPVRAWEPMCDLHLVGDGYIVCYEPGYAADAELAREIIDDAAQRLRREYGRPGPFELQVKLYARPGNGVGPGQTYFDGRAIHYLTPSAPQRTGGTSVLGLPLDSEEFHQKTLTHEYFHAFHLARNRTSFEWGGWFTEAIAEYEGTFGPRAVRRLLYDRLIHYVHGGQRNRVFCCRTLEQGVQAITTNDAYFSGAAILRFLEDRFGRRVPVRLVNSSLPTFEEALEEELAANGTTVQQAFSQLDRWLADEAARTQPDYRPSMACTGRYWESTSGLSFEVRITNNHNRPSSHVTFEHQHRAAAGPPWTTHRTRSRVESAYDRFGVSLPRFTGPNSAPFQIRFRSIGDGLYSAWSNVIAWTAARCATTFSG